MNEIITSLQNPQVKLWRTLNRSHSARVSAKLFLAEGEHLAGEALKEKKARALLADSGEREKYAALMETASMQGVLVYLLASHVMEALSDAKTPQGVIAVCDYPEGAMNADPGRFLAALDGVQDPGNVGTIIRTMDAAGYSCLLMDEKTADPYAPKALRATMGGAFRVPAVRLQSLVPALRALKEQGYEIAAGDLHGQDFFHRPPARDKICVVIGNEGQGVSPAVLSECTMRLKIPILGGAESLNAAVAGAIMMYDFVREKNR
ncbi:MAG: RNA methyltransferase [Clostridia bacterium]|nr:RNA methyltransferase [Clostridia bacterium]